MMNVLIVDDEMLMRIGLRSLIEWEQFGFQIIGEAANGKEALALAKQHKVDLIITDIKMPVMDGLDLIREASKLMKDCIYVVLSNFDDFHYVREAFQLGAHDYLIKSDIHQDAMAALLSGVKRKLLQEGNVPAAGTAAPLNFQHSWAYLKENVIKDLVSGLVSADEFERKAKQLDMALLNDSLCVIKFRIAEFDEVKKKYAEKDEKLLRYSILNIMEELIPSKLRKEIIVENSAEYLLLLNERDEDWPKVRESITRQCEKVIQTMKDYINLRFFAGISSIVSGFHMLKLAYQEADFALSRRFFAGSKAILFYEDVAKPPAYRADDWQIGPGFKHEFAVVLESGNERRLIPFMDNVRHHLQVKSSNEEIIRETYMLLLELAHAKFSPDGRLRQAQTEKSPYETVRTAETWEDLHRTVTDYILQCFQRETAGNEWKSHVDLAIERILAHYTEDISLQSVAAQINVNPSYLSRIFKQQTGRNFVTFLTHLRIEKAKQLLENESLKVYEIAHQVGYPNYTYFSKLFKKITGQSPEEYRSFRGG